MWFILHQIVQTIKYYSASDSPNNRVINITLSFTIDPITSPVGSRLTASPKMCRFYAVFSYETVRDRTKPYKTVRDRTKPDEMMKYLPAVTTYLFIATLVTSAHWQSIVTPSGYAINYIITSCGPIRT